jgi:hypothetical protein
MISSPGRAVEWLSVTLADALPPPAMFHPAVDEWLNIEERERRAGVLAGIPIVVGLASPADPSGTDSELDLRLIDFMNHPLGAAVSAGLTGEVIRYQLPVFLRWLAGRGKSWDAATVQDLVA